MYEDTAVTEDFSYNGITAENRKSKVENQKSKIKNRCIVGLPIVAHGKYGLFTRHIAVISIAMPPLTAQFEAVLQVPASCLQYPYRDLSQNVAGR